MLRKKNGLAAVERERILEEHALTRFCGRERGIKKGGKGQGERHGVEVVAREELEVVLVCIDGSEAKNKRPRPLHAQVGDGDETHFFSVEGPHAERVARRKPAAADAELLGEDATAGSNIQIEDLRKSVKNVFTSSLSATTSEQSVNLADVG